MPDNKGWRKKIHSKQPKDLALLTIASDDTEEASERRRPHGWRKAIHGSRPGTPSGGALTTSMLEDAEDARSDRSDVSTPRQNSRPKLARYTLLFSSFKEPYKGPEFAEPWKKDAPPPFELYVDPLDVLQSIRSHMNNSRSQPIPLQYNNGLFRIFEDYQKVRQENERLEVLLQDTIRDWRRAEAQWSDFELCYKAEIRRLDLLIAKGTSGISGFVGRVSCRECSTDQQIDLFEPARAV